MAAVMGLVWLLTGCETAGAGESVDVSALQLRLSAVEARLEVAEGRVDETAATVAGLAPALVPEPHEAPSTDPVPSPSVDPTITDRLADHEARLQAMEVEGATQHWVIEQGYAGVAEQRRLDALIQGFAERLNGVPAALDVLASQLAAGLGRVGALEASLAMQTTAMGAVQVILAPDGDLQASVEALREAFDGLVAEEGRLVGIEAEVLGLAEAVTAEGEQRAGDDRAMSIRIDGLLNTVSVFNRWRQEIVDILGRVEAQANTAENWARGAGESANLNSVAIAGVAGQLERRLEVEQPLTDLLAYLTVDTQTHDIYLTGANLNVRKRADTNQADGLGNLIVGYNFGPAEHKTGSHNLVVGPSHTYTSLWGIVAGYDHAITAPRAAAIGGNGSTVEGAGAVSVGGRDATVTGDDAVVLGGSQNTATGRTAVMVGGSGNAATATGAVMVGGRSMQAAQAYRTVVGP
jgi:hypothetical protein